MTAGADPAWRAIVRQIRADLRPFPGRFAMTWRVALLCALVAGVAMLYKIPESAIGCYLIIYLARPDGAECVAQALGIIVLASIVVLALAPLIAATADEPLLRITAIALISFVFVFLGAATQLGESGSIIALVVVFILTLVDLLPAGEIATRALIYAWKMACVPMVMMIGFNLLLGTSPHRLLRRTVEDRLAAAAAALDVPGDGGAARGPPGVAPPRQLDQPRLERGEPVDDLARAGRRGGRGRAGEPRLRRQRAARPVRRAHPA